MPLGSTVDVFATDDPNLTEVTDQELQIYEKRDNMLHGHRNKRYPIRTPTQMYTFSGRTRALCSDQSSLIICQSNYHLGRTWNDESGLLVADF